MNKIILSSLVVVFLGGFCCSGQRILEIHVMTAVGSSASVGKDDIAFEIFDDPGSCIASCPGCGHAGCLFVPGEIDVFHGEQLETCFNFELESFVVPRLRMNHYGSSSVIFRYEFTRLLLDDEMWLECHGPGSIIGNGFSEAPCMPPGTKTLPAEKENKMDNEEQN